MFVTTYRNPSESEVWLYKHNPGTMPPVREGEAEIVQADTVEEAAALLVDKLLAEKVV